MNIKVEGDVRKLVLDLAVAKYKLELYLGESPGVTYTLASIHSHYAKEYDIEFYYDSDDDLGKLTSDLWEIVKNEQKEEEIKQGGVNPTGQA